MSKVRAEIILLCSLTCLCIQGEVEYAVWRVLWFSICKDPPNIVLVETVYWVTV